MKKQSALISAQELAILKRLCESKGVYWKLADYHYDARLSPGVVLKLVAEIEELWAALDVYNEKLRLLRAKYGLDVLAGDVERLYEAHEQSETDLGILRLKAVR